MPRIAGLIFNGKCDDWPAETRLPWVFWGYCTGIFLKDLSTKTTEYRTTNIIIIYKIIVRTFRFPIETKLYNFPIAEGAPVNIDAVIINDKPFPIPLFVICSPSHITKKVPAVRLKTVSK